MPTYSNEKQGKVIVVEGSLEHVRLHKDKSWVLETELDNPENVDSLTNKELQLELNFRGLKTTGNKAELQERLEEAVDESNLRG